MPKKEINVKKIEKFLKDLFIKSVNFIKDHVESFLILVFFISLIFSGYIFYKYAYKAILKEPKVSVTSMKIKESQLKEVVEDIKRKEEERLLIYKENNIKNIFEEKNEELTTGEESSAKNIPTPRFQ